MEPTDQCRRYDRSQKEKIDVQRPAAVAIYNKFMRGVDNCDMFLSLYRAKVRTRKWYLRIAFHLFSFASINSWILFQALDRKYPLVKYLVALATSLITGKPDYLNSSKDDSDIEHDNRKPESRKACQVITHQRCSKYNHWTQIECKNRKGVKKKDTNAKHDFGELSAKFVFVFPDRTVLKTFISLNDLRIYSAICHIYVIFHLL